MKQYKLLKDTPTLKAGTVFEESINIFGIKFLINEELEYQFEVEKIDNFDDWFEEIPEENKRWRAKEGGRYYYIDDCGSVLNSYDYRYIEDDYRYNTGNYGRIKEGLEAKREYDIAHQVLLDDAEGGKFAPHKINYYAFSGRDGNWLFDWDHSYELGQICFKDRESLQKSLEEHKKQWEIVRKYEMGEM